MGKDKIGYHASKKRSHGSKDLELNVGITAAVSASPHGGSRQDCEALLERRPTALFKWSFDDYVVEEILPSTFGDAPCGNATALIRITSEGLPSSLVARHVRSALGTNAPLHFLSPIDFVSCTTRYLWVKLPYETVAQAFPGTKVFHTSHGIFYVDEVRQVPLSASETSFPLQWLPSFQYTITLRDIRASLAQVLPALRSLASVGHLNYSHMGRHGLGLHQTYMEAKALMERDYPTLVRRYVDSLSEGTTHVRREISTLLDVLSELNCTEKEWNGLVQGMDSAVKNDSTVLHFPSTGLYYPHHYLLQDFVNRASTIFPQHHDSAQVIRETISRNVLGEKMRSITDVHFNAMASLRWEGGGDKVRVGDLVVKDKATRCLLDNYEASADVIHGSLTDNLHPLWCELASSEGRLPEGLREIQTVHEAAQHTIHDVVLPLYGRNAAHLPVLPARSPFLKLAEELNVTGVEKMKTAFPAGYRPLLARPEESYGFYLVDEGRQWEWEEGPLAGALKQSLYKDQDNITRMRSPLMERSKKNMIARRGIRGEEARRFFLKPARKSGVLCVMRMTLPRGTAITSSLREVFQFATLSPSAIFQLLSP